MGEKQRTLLIIEEFASNLVAPNRAMTKEYFKISSYSIWALSEISSRIENSGSETPLEIIRKFDDQMRKYSLMNSEPYSMFTVASDIAGELLEVFDAME